MKTLKERLKKNIEKVYLVQGDDFYLFEKAKSMILKAANITLPDLNLAIFDDDNFSEKSFFEGTQVFPIGDDFRVVVLNGVTKITEGEKKQFLSTLEGMVDTCVVVVLDYGGKFDFLKNKAEFVDAKRMEKQFLVKIIVAELSKNGKKISADGVDALIEATNGYLTKIMNEIAKLSYYCEEELITKKIVSEIVIKEVEYTVFELTEALSKRDGDKAISLLNLMEKEQGILPLISNHFRRLFFISISDMSDKELSSYLGVKEYAITKSRSFLKGFSKVQLKNIINLLEEVDFKIKSGEMLGANALYYLVFKILYI